MKKELKITLIVIAAFVALTVLFNLLPDGIRVTATLCTVGGIIGGWIAKIWYDRQKQQ